MDILCKSINKASESTKCVACMDAFESQGGNIGCCIAEDCDFDKDVILQECEYAQNNVIKQS